MESVLLAILTLVPLAAVVVVAVDVRHGGLTAHEERVDEDLTEMPGCRR